MIANEEHDTYAAWLASFLKGRDPLEVQQETPLWLAERIEHASQEELGFSPASGRWSITEILAHLAEAELINSWRYRQMIEHPGCTLSSYDQDVWARLGDYAAWRASDALALFRLLRETNSACSQR